MSENTYKTEPAYQAPSSLLHWRAYLELCKPKVVALIIFTALIGMLLSSPNMVPLDLVFFGLLGIGLASASGAALNHWFDRKIDAIMDRTNQRPIVQGELSPTKALVFAITIGAIGEVLLIAFVNNLTALLTFFSLIGYAVIYTVLLKRNTPHNIVLGGAAGAAPPLLGWCAITGNVTLEPIILFMIIFTWTPPHFWALAINRRKEYADAGLPMLPVTHGVDFTKYQIILYTLLLFLVTLTPFIVGMNGLIYLIGAVTLGVTFIYHAHVLFEAADDEHAMPTFGFSIVYLMALFAFLLVDHYTYAYLLISL